MKSSIARLDEARELPVSSPPKISAYREDPRLPPSADTPYELLLESSARTVSANSPAVVFQYDDHAGGRTKRPRLLVDFERAPIAGPPPIHGGASGWLPRPRAQGACQRPPCLLHLAPAARRRRPSRLIRRRAGLRLGNEPDEDIARHRRAGVHLRVPAPRQGICLREIHRRSREATGADRKRYTGLTPAGAGRRPLPHFTAAISSDMPSTTSNCTSPSGKVHSWCHSGAPASAYET